MTAKTPHVLIVEGRFYNEISDYLKRGAIRALEDAGAGYEVLSVPGALEIPSVIKFSAHTKKYDAYVALGCVIRGETSHYDIVAGESARGLMDLGIQENLCIGNGILTCENKMQAIVRADPAQKNKGRDAAEAALALLTIKHLAGLTL
jgi:6,7-dimethyl-8-ribityllumazine synthase